MFGLDLGTIFAGLVSFFGLIGSVLGLLHFKHVWVREMLGRLVKEAEAAVREVSQTYTTEILKGRQDGVLTEEEKAVARRRAVEILKSNFGLKGLKRLAHVLGIVDDDRYAVTQVEAAVNRMKTK